MLKLQILKRSHMTTSPKQLLRALQDEHTNELELLVRESIQNSLDAGIDGKAVHMDFSIKSFNSLNFSKFLPGITEELNKRYEDKSKVLTISDKYTEGLTGELDYSKNEKGNLIKLVYQIGDAQEKEGSGGSWGYGKTIYYRVGIGLVGFYSRVFENNEYKERLVISLVEDEEPKNIQETLYKNYRQNEIGIMWWGDLNDKGDSIPITDSNIIKEVLLSLNLKPYEDDETGTVIIIPYIDEDELLASIDATSNEPYYESVIEFLEFSVQRWYAPRINNPYYSIGKKNNLFVSFNDKKLLTEDQEKIFVLIKELYNAAFSNDLSTVLELAPNSEIKHDPIRVLNVKGLVGNTIGQLVFGKFNYKDLGLDGVEDRNNPYLMFNINNLANKENSPVVFFTRQPGMIVKYDCSTDWVRRIPDSPKEEYYLAFFILNSSKEIYFETYDGNIDLESMIRDKEKSTHNDWYDFEYRLKNKQVERPTIITRIKNNISNKIRSNFVKEVETKPTTSAEYISKLFGSQIMPPLGFGKSTKIPDEGRGSSSPRQIRQKNLRTTFYFNNITYSYESIRIPFRITPLIDDIKDITINVLFKTDTGSLLIPKYEKELERAAPIKIENIILNKDQYKNAYEKTLFGTKYNNKIIGDFNKNEDILGSLVIYYTDKFIELDFKVEAELKDE